MNKEYNYSSTPYFIFDRNDSIPYLARIRNKEWCNVFVSYSIFYKIDVTVGRLLRKLLVSTGTASVFTRTIYNLI